MRILRPLALLLCACAVCACSSPSSDITSAADDLTRLLTTAARGPLTRDDARKLRADLQTLVADQAGQNALVATGALTTAGQQAAADLRTAARALGPARAQAARARVCTETFGVDVAAAGRPARATDPGIHGLLARAAQLRGGGQTPEAYLGSLTDALCR